MKKTCIIILAAFILACNSAGDDKASNADTTASKNEETVGGGTTSLPPGITQADYDKGLELVAQSDCPTCHQVNTKVNGPAYADVANKYEATEANITMLAQKVMKGGSGVWGQVPMLAHPDIPEEEAKAMVKYVLSLRTAK